MRETAEFLWALLDDIDTASDAAKGNDKLYRQMVEVLQRRRFEVGSTDGYSITFPSEQISGEAVERVTEAMVARAHAEYHKVLGDPNRSNPMKAALEAAIGGRP